MNGLTTNTWRSRKGRGHYLWVLALAWSLLLVFSLLWNTANVTEQVTELVRVQARTAYEKDVLYRFWNSSHGLVYVPVSTETPPNPYLEVPERDIATPSGTPLTLMNPAYMTRQANELGRKRLGIYGHLTSLMPLRPANAPDEWEKKALLAFEQGVEETSNIDEFQGKQVMRLMRPLLVEEECIECHAQQGYKVGEIRGGISVSVDMTPSLALLAQAKLRLRIGHLLLWLTGMAGLLVRSRMLVKRDLERQQSADQLQQINNELEIRVDERTRELADSNRALEEDIRQRIAAEEERERLAAQLRQAQKMELIGTLAGGIAHGFNNLLTPILGYAELAANRAGVTETLQKDLHQISGAANRAKGLVRQILAFSRQGEQSRMPVCMQQILGEVLELIRPTFPKSIRINAHLPDEELMVDADPVQIHQVVMNLCTNAWQAMVGNQGVLELHLEKQSLSAQAAEPLGLPGGEYLCLQVQDSGSGIDEQTREKIFEPFFTTKQNGEGTGLGLSVVHGIVHSHQGAIQVDSCVGQGTCFRIYLPLISREQEVAEKQAVPQANGERILVVDDEAEIVALLSEGLPRFGYQVSGFSDSRAAYQAFKQNPEAYDLLLSDRIMPEMGGEALAEGLRQLRPGLPVLFISGYDAEAGGLIEKTLFGDPCLAKPLTASEVARQLALLLKEQKASG